MTYFELVQAIEALALIAGCKSFWSGPKTQNGINYDQPFPMAEFYNTQPLAVRPTVLSYNIGMGIYGADEHENGGDDTLLIQSDMIELLQRFEALLRESEDFELEDRAGGAIIATQVIRTGTKIGTGVFIDFTLHVARVC